MKCIKIRVLDFTENPGPRYIRQDRIGDSTSGEAFYIEKLNCEFAQAVKDRKMLMLELDGVSGYPSSFLDEAIGELVFDFTLKIVSEFLDFNTVMYKRRVKQVKEETYLQWEQRRINKNIVMHSPGVDTDIYYIDDEGVLKTKHIHENS